MPKLTSELLNDIQANKTAEKIEITGIEVKDSALLQQALGKNTTTHTFILRSLSKEEIIEFFQAIQKKQNIVCHLKDLDTKALGELYKYLTTGVTSQDCKITCDKSIPAQWRNKFSSLTKSVVPFNEKQIDLEKMKLSIQQAKDLRKQKKYQEGLVILTKLTNFLDTQRSIPTELSEVYLLAGLLYYDLRQNELHIKNALFSFNKALEINPKCLESRIQRSRLVAEHIRDINYRDQAFEDLAYAIEAKPTVTDLSEILRIRAALHQQKCDFDLSLSDINKAIEIIPDCLINYLHRGIIFVNICMSKRKETYLDEAIADFTKVIETDTSTLELLAAYFHRGRCLEILKKNEAALKDFQIFIKGKSHHSPHYKSAIESTISILKGLDRKSEATALINNIEKEITQVQREDVKSTVWSGIAPDGDRFNVNMGDLVDAMNKKIATDSDLMAAINKKAKAGNVGKPFRISVGDQDFMITLEAEDEQDKGVSKIKNKSDHGDSENSKLCITRGDHLISVTEDEVDTPYIKLKKAAETGDLKRFNHYFNLCKDQFKIKHPEREDTSSECFLFSKPSMIIFPAFQAFVEATKRKHVNMVAKFFELEIIRRAKKFTEYCAGFALLNKQMIKLFLDNGLNVNTRSDTGNNDRTLIHLAAHYGFIEVVRLLLEFKADPNLSDDLGQTPLFSAISKGFTAIALLLIRSGADLDKIYDGKTILQIAREKKNTQIVQLINMKKNIPEKPKSELVKSKKVKKSEPWSDQLNKVLKILTVKIDPLTIALEKFPAQIIEAKFRKAHQDVVVTINAKDKKKINQAIKQEYQVNGKAITEDTILKIIFNTISNKPQLMVAPSSQPDSNPVTESTKEIEFTRLIQKVETLIQNLSTLSTEMKSKLKSIRANKGSALYKKWIDLKAGADEYEKYLTIDYLAELDKLGALKRKKQENRIRPLFNIDKWLDETTAELNNIMSEFLTHQRILKKYSEILNKDLEPSNKNSEKKAIEASIAAQVFEKEKNKILDQFNELIESVETSYDSLKSLETKTRDNLAILSKDPSQTQSIHPHLNTDAEKTLASIAEILTQAKVYMGRIYNIRRDFSAVFRQSVDSASLQKLKPFLEEPANLKSQFNQFKKTMIEINQRLEKDVVTYNNALMVQAPKTSLSTKGDEKISMLESASATLSEKFIEMDESDSVNSEVKSQTEKSPVLKPVSHATRIRDLLNHVFQMVITNGHIHLEHLAEEKGLSSEERSLIHDIQHFASLYCVLRCSDALKKLQRHLNFPESLAIDSLIEFTNMLSKRGVEIVSFEIAMATAKQMSEKLPEQIRKIRRPYLNQSALTDDQLKDLVGLFGISDNPGKYLLEPTIPVVEDLLLFKMLQAYHLKLKTTDVSETHLHHMIYDVCVPKIQNIMASIQKMYPNAAGTRVEFSKFNERYYLHILALKMLLFICGSFCSEEECVKRKRLVRHKKLADKAAHNKLYNFLSFCRVLIRNSVRHEFLNDCRLEDIYEACRLTEALTKKPLSELFSEKSKASKGHAKGMAKLGLLKEAKKQIQEASDQDKLATSVSLINA